jgi:hypothetical protein
MPATFPRPMATTCREHARGSPQEYSEVNPYVNVRRCISLRPTPNDRAAGVDVQRTRHVLAQLFMFCIHILPYSIDVHRMRALHTSASVERARNKIFDHTTDTIRLHVGRQCVIMQFSTYLRLTKRSRKGTPDAMMPRKRQVASFSLLPSEEGDNV